MRNEQIISDLMGKVSDDVSNALCRTLALCPEPKLPVAIAGGAAAIGTIAAVLNTAPKAGKIDPECVLLAALLCAWVALDPKNGVHYAYRDLETLRPLLPSHRKPE
jgi:hypothetical protein